MDTKHGSKKECLRIGFDIAKLTFKAAALVAAFLTVKEIHKVHKAIEHSHKLAK